MKPDPWIQERNAEIVQKYKLLRRTGAGYQEAIDILAREYHRGFSTVANLIRSLSKRGDW